MKKILLSLGFNQAIYWTILSRSWTIIGGLGSIYFVTKYLSPQGQGYYYTFNSLVALQVLVELGLNYAIIQFASHEMAHLEIGSDRIISGDLAAKKRLQSLFKFSLCWFTVAAVLLLLILIPGGIIFFQKTASKNIQIHTELAWIFIVIFTSGALLVNCGLAFMEGCNKVVEVTKIRLLQVIFSVLTTWIALANNADLMALAIGSFVMVLVGSFCLYKNFRPLIFDLWHFENESPELSWKKEIWPFQWRIAVSWASGYLIFQIFTPILFASAGPIAAGKMGMSLQIISAMNGLAMVWITTRAPLFGQLIASKNRAHLDILFSKSLKQSGFILICGEIALLIIVFLLNTYEPIYASRVVSTQQFFILCIACLGNHIIFSMAAYMRAHKIEPFMLISLVQGLIVISLLFLARDFGINGAIFAYASGVLLVGLPFGILVFKKFRTNIKIMNWKI